jgi:hypothetical protein
MSAHGRELVRTYAVSVRRAAQHLLAATVLSLAVACPAAAQSPVTFLWDANEEPDLAAYVLLWGLASRTYTSSQEVGVSPEPTATLTFTPGTWYVAVRAVNEAGQHSQPSNEVVVTIGTTPGPRRIPLVVVGLSWQVRSDPDE